MQRVEDGKQDTFSRDRRQIAKRDYAEKMAAASNMTYFLLKASDAENGRYKMMWSKEGRDTYVDTISQPTIGLLG